MFNASIMRGVTGDILVKVHNAGCDRCFNELYANYLREGGYFKHAWVISLNKASHHIKIKCEYTLIGCIIKPWVGGCVEGGNAKAFSHTHTRSHTSSTIIKVYN